jgi:hypothetical protein
MRLYRLLTGKDDDVFCERIETLLNRGWHLHGPPSLTFNGVDVIAGQAVVKEVDGAYAGFVHLRDMYPEQTTQRTRSAPREHQPASPQVGGGIIATRPPVQNYSENQVCPARRPGHTAATVRRALVDRGSEIVRHEAHLADLTSVAAHFKGP